MSSNTWCTLYIYMEGSLGSIFGGQWAHARVILVLRKCIWNARMVSLVLPAFDGTRSLGFPTRRVVYSPGSTLNDCPLFPCGEYGTWSKTHQFLFTPTFPCFLIFPLLLNPQRYNTLECCLLGLLLNNNNNDNNNNNNNNNMTTGTNPNDANAGGVIWVGVL